MSIADKLDRLRGLGHLLTPSERDTIRRAVEALRAGEKQSLGARLIAAERQRQIEREGWTAEHDDEHGGGEMVRAGVCYAQRAGDDTLGLDNRASCAWVSWPWAPSWWKPSADPVRNLEKAGALIAAEIDRLLRKAERERPSAAPRKPLIGCPDCTWHGSYLMDHCEEHARPSAAEEKP